MDDLDFSDADMAARADEAAAFLKALSNPARLRILCALVPREHSVGELEEQLGASQSYVSGQLARLRAEGYVTTRREGRSILYRLSDPRVSAVIERLWEVFCEGRY